MAHCKMEKTGIAGQDKKIHLVGTEKRKGRHFCGRMGHFTCRLRVSSGFRLDVLEEEIHRLE